MDAEMKKNNNKIKSVKIQHLCNMQSHQLLKTVQNKNIYITCHSIQGPRVELVPAKATFRKKIL